MSAIRRSTVRRGWLFRPTDRRGWLSLGVAVLLALTAAAIVVDTLIWMVRAWSPMPLLDQWDVVVDYATYGREGPSWDGLFRQHMEHRLVFPRLLFLADYEWFDGRNVVLIALVALIQAAATATLLLAGGGDKRGHRALSIAVAAAVTALMFSLYQHENFRWGFQVQFVGVYACAIGAYALLHRCLRLQTEQRAWAGSMAAAVALLVVGTFTMANGVIAAWLSIPLALLLGVRRRGLMVLGVAVFASTLLFFEGYQSGPSGTVLGLLGSPVEAARFVLSYLGNIAWNLGQGQARYAISLGLGLAGVALTAAASWRILRGKDRASIRLAYFTLILLVSISAVLTAAGRMSFGIEHAFNSRYTTPVALYWVSHLLYWRSVCADGGRRTLPVWIGAALAIVVAAAAQIAVKPDLTEQVAALDLASDALLTDVADTYALERAYPRPNVVFAQQSFLKGQRLSVFAGPEADWMGKPLAAVARIVPRSQCSGSFDLIDRLPLNLGKAVQVAGWAWDRAHMRPAHRVLLVGADQRVTGLATVGLRRPDVRAAAPAIYSSFTGWRGYARVPDGGSVSAFVVLSNNAACPIGAPMTAPTGPRPTLTSYAGGPGQNLDAPVDIQNGFALDRPPFEVAAPAPPNAYASWMGDDASTGAVRFGPFVSRTGKVAFQVVTGPDASGARLDLTDPDTGQVVQAFALPVIAEWRAVSVPVEPGRKLVLRAQDYGAGYGQWLGITPPQDVAP